jgi:hypothetical protein
MATQESQLLRVDEVVPKALIVWLAMVQLSNGRNEVHASMKEIRRRANQLAKGRRMTSEDIMDFQDDLIEIGLLPSKNKVYPFGGTSEQVSDEQAQEIVQAAVKNYKRGLPPADDDNVAEHARLGHFLVSVRAQLFCQKFEYETLRDQNGQPILVDGQQKRFLRSVWDYAFAQKMLNQYGFDRIFEVVSNLYVKGLLDQIKHDGTRQGKKKALTRYIIAVLNGEKTVERNGDEYIPDLT